MFSGHSSGPFGTRVMLPGAAVCSSPLPAVHTSTAKVVVLGTSSPFVNTNGWLSDTCLRLTLDTT